MRIFVSRYIDEDSCLHELSLAGHDVTARSLLDFAQIAIDVDPQQFDWLFFYSKRGVKHLVSQLSTEQVQIVRSKKLGCIGEGTAGYLVELLNIDKVDFIASTELEQDLDQFASLISDSKVLISRAEDSRLRLESILQQSQFTSLVTYSNSSSDYVIQDHDVYCFTSPLNALTSVNSRASIIEAKTVAIGQTTFRQMLLLGYRNIRICSEPKEREILSEIQAYL